MLKIGICDDDAIQREQIHRWIEKELFRYTELSIIHFSSGEEIVEAIDKNHFDVQLLILDVHMKQLDGISVAAYIRENHLDIDIIFMTVSPEHVYEGYTHKAFAYLLKPVEEASFRKILNQFIDEWGRGTEYLEMNSRGEVKRINLRKVLYITSDVRVVEVHMLDRVERYYGRLDDIEKQVSPIDFIRCHKSYLVNKRMIESMARECFWVRGERIPVSRHYYEKLRDQGLYKKNRVQESEKKSLATKWSHTGALIGINGKHIGAIFRMKAGKQIIVGRDQDVADIVLDDVSISRKHCWIQYNAVDHTYSVCDESTNGILINEMYYLKKEQVVTLNKGDELCFADTENIFKLG